MENLKRIREESGLRQEDVAVKLNIDRSAVAKWETGKAMPSAKKLKEIALIFNCTVDELLQ